MADIELIHAGLPWNNPEKITVKADEYISELVINRGLLNLLSNDYYLDLKTLRINQYIVDLLGPHIGDSSIHWTEDLLVDLIQKYLNGEVGSFFADGFGLGNNTAFIIPINSITNPEPYVNATRIQNIINQCPKNLNGNVAIFAFTPVVDFEKTSVNYNTSITDFYKNKKTTDNEETLFTDELIVDVVTNNITFNGFYGGTVIVLGNNYFVCDEETARKGKILSVKESRMFLEQLQNDIEASLNGEEIKTRLKNITIKGNCRNNNCAVLSFFNCNCDSYLWNLKIQMYTSNSVTQQDTPSLPSKDTLSLFFPANGEYDKVPLGRAAKYIVAAAANSEEFSNSYISLKSKYQEMELDKEENCILLNKDCFNSDLISDQIRKILFGRYLDLNGVLQTLSYYNGGSLSFWMKGNFYDENVTTVPILYSKDANENGFYFGLEKVASIQDGNLDVTQYLETSYASKKKDDLNGKWNFWTINVSPLDIDALLYQIEIYYADSNKLINKILPSKIINMDENHNMLAYNNIISLPSLNFGGNIHLFGTPDDRYFASIRNILLCNEALSEEYIQNFAGLGLVDNYNLDFLLSKSTFTNGMKGALYVYNTTSMNILGCAFSKIIEIEL